MCHDRLGCHRLMLRFMRVRSTTTTTPRSSHRGMQSPSPGNTSPSRSAGDEMSLEATQTGHGRARHRGDAQTRREIVCRRARELRVSSNRPDGAWQGSADSRVAPARSSGRSTAGSDQSAASRQLRMPRRQAAWTGDAGDVRPGNDPASAERRRREQSLRSPRVSNYCWARHWADHRRHPSRWQSVEPRTITFGSSCRNARCQADEDFA